MTDDSDDSAPIMIGGLQVHSESPRRTDIPPIPRPVIVTDIQMPFGSMVVFMLKWAFASIPAAIIILMTFGLISGILGGLFRR